MLKKLFKSRNLIFSIIIFVTGAGLSLGAWSSMRQTLAEQLNANWQLSALDRNTPTVVLFEGVLTSALIAIIYYYLATSSARSAALAEKIKSDLRASEEEYRTLVSNINVGIYRSAITDGGFMAANPALMKMFGYSAEEILKKTLSDIYPTSEGWEALIKAIKRDGSVSNKEFKLVKSNGDQFWASVTAQAHFDNNHVIDWVDGIIEDISLRKEAEAKVEERTEELEEAKAKDEAILSSINDGVFVVDRERRFLLFNPAAESITGFGSSEVLGRKFADILEFVSEDEGQGVAEFITKSMVTGMTQRSDPHTSLIIKNGQKIAISSSASPLKRDNEVVGCVVIFRNVEKERAVDKVKTEFVSLASHQLRTPLSTISWYTEMILNGDVGKINVGQKKYLNEVYHANRRMVDLVNALLNVSRLELGTFSVEPQPTDLSKVIPEVLSELQEKIVTHKLEVKVSVDADLPPVPLDPKLIHIVFQNLVSNAVKYTPAEGSVTIAVSRKDPALTAMGKEGKKFLIIKVSDTGIGIPREAHKSIFSKLFRADNGREVDPEGTGLGLYLTKSIIEQGGGKIWFESEENKGTTFFATVPLEGMKKKEGEKKLV